MLRRDSRRGLTGVVWAAVAVNLFFGLFVVTRFSETRELGIRDVAALRFGFGAPPLTSTLARGRGVSALVAAATMWGIYTLQCRKSTLSPVESAAPIHAWLPPSLISVYVFLGLSCFSYASAAAKAVYQGVLMSMGAVFTCNRFAFALLVRRPQLR